MSDRSGSQKVAVIGSGISGLSAAWFLGQKHQVTLLEKNARLGGHTHTVNIKPSGADMESIAVDTGFIVFNRPNYPHLSAMLEYLNVAVQKTEMSFSASIDQGKMEYSGHSLSTMFAQRRNLLSFPHWKMIGQILRFNRQAKEDLNASQDLNLTLGEYLNKHGFEERMQEYYLLPMAAAIWSCPVSTMMRFPVGSFLQFFENHGLLNIEDRPQWETVINGSQNYIDAILQEDAFQVRLNAGVKRVDKRSDGLCVVFENGQETFFDQVVFASHADQTWNMLAADLKYDLKPLASFAYQKNVAYLHSDLSLMPKRKRAWSSWNYLRETHFPEKAVAVTYWMNRLQNLETHLPILVTLNPVHPPQEDKTYQRMVYEHPVFDQAALDAQAALPGLQGKHNLWFCGAWTGYGFHEDGLKSAVELARSWGVELPWEERV